MIFFPGAKTQSAEQSVTGVAKNPNDAWYRNLGDPMN
jgi:hypothetical protein